MLGPETPDLLPLNFQPSNPETRPWQVKRGLEGARRAPRFWLRCFSIFHVFPLSFWSFYCIGIFLFRLSSFCLLAFLLSFLFQLFLVLVRFLLLHRIVRYDTQA